MRGVRELAVVLSLVAVSVLVVRPTGKAAQPSAAPTPPPLAAPSVSFSWWELAVQDLDAHASDQPGYRKVRSLKQQPPAFPARADNLFWIHCASCHGSAGEGPLHPPITTGAPPNLQLPSAYRHGTRELAIFRTAKYGLPGTGMPPIYANDEELWTLALHVRSLQTK